MVHPEPYLESHEDLVSGLIEGIGRVTKQVTKSP